VAEAAERHGTSDPTRRVVLAAAATSSLLLAGCKGIRALGPPPGLSPDVVTLEHAITAEELMVSTYSSALTALAGDAKAGQVLARVLAEHGAHLGALRSRLILPHRTASATPRPSPVAPAMPADRQQVLARLAAAEQAAVTRLTGQLRDVPAALAQLMASISASEAAHLVFLHQAGLTR